MFALRSLISKNKSAFALAKKCTQISSIPARRFCQAQVEEVTEETKLESMTEEERLVYNCQKFGADLTFNESKHGYILEFPWNFEGIIEDFEAEFKPLGEDNFWHKWIFNRECDRDFNELFRVFHQSWAIPDYQGIDRVCEPRLANEIKTTVDNIQSRGVDIEMANLRVHQPKIEILKVEVHHGISANRAENKPLEAYNVEESTFFGAPLKVYTNKNGDNRSVFDFFDLEYKPYLISVTALIHSPMKLYVWNQNKTKVLFGSDDSEQVKNVVKFETNIRWTELYKLAPVPNKPLLRTWKITDYNNVMNENPYF